LVFKFWDSKWKTNDSAPNKREFDCIWIINYNTALTHYIGITGWGLGYCRLHLRRKTQKLGTLRVIIATCILCSSYPPRESTGLFYMQVGLRSPGLWIISQIKPWYSLSEHRILTSNGLQTEVVLTVETFYRVTVSK
jgi:hypothetical protein